MVSIDGADAIDNTINGVRSTLSQEAVQEFQIIKSGYAPEYGRASAATINIVSKQGTNQWKGNLFGCLRSRNGSATNAFAGEPNPGDTRTQAGLTLGGPLRRDKTFVFLSFETNLRNSIYFSQIGRNNYGFRAVTDPFGMGTLLLTPQQEAFVRSAPPALAVPYASIANRAAQVAIFGNTPGGPQTFGLIPNPLPVSFSGLSTEAGNYKTTEETYFYSVRFDHQISQIHNAFVRFSATPADVTGVPSNGQNQLTALNGFSRTTNNSTRDIAIVGQLKSNLSSSLLSELRFQFARRGVGLTTNSTRVAIEIPGIASIGMEPFAPVYRSEKRWQFTENVTHIRSGHTYKMGVDFNHLPVKASFPLNQGAVYYFPAALAVDNPLIVAAVTPAVAAAWRSSGAPPFNSAQPYGFGFPESFVQQFGGLERTTSRYDNTTLGWFVQDSWKLAQNLTLNYGVRYDTEFTPLVPASSPLSEAGEKLLNVVQGIPRDTNNWAPRLGFAWDPFKSGLTVVRGSYGLFCGHPLTGIIFLSDVVDGTQSPYLVAPGGVGADDLFHGRAFTPLGSAVANPAIGYISSQQRYDVLAPAFQNQVTALALSPILSQTLPVAGNFDYDDTQQGTFGIERQIGTSLSLGADYTYTHGSHCSGRETSIRVTSTASWPMHAQLRFVQTCQALRLTAVPIRHTEGAGSGLAGLWGGVFDSPWKSSALLRDWTFSPTIEASSGRPYNLLTLNDSTLINSGSTARPSVVPIGTAGSFASPDAKVGLIQPALGSVGNLGRNVYRTSNFSSVDFRLTRRIVLREKRRLEFSVDVFNLFNRVNIREADNSFTQAGRPVGAFHPRQLQFSAKVVF